ncbi:MAG: 3-keto-5-aminohexanoate cleavage protein [Acidimicrobiia bacterium]
MATTTESPVIIEAAITPLRRGVPAQSVEDMVADAVGCIDAGAGIIHHHHDMRLDDAGSIQQLIDTGRRILDAHPGALIYTDYLTGQDKPVWEENAHLRAMADADVLTMFAVDPGITAFPSRGRDGLLTHTYLDGLRFSEAHELVAFSKEVGVPVSLGVFEPGQLRWIVTYAHEVGFSPGTIIKLYFGGYHMVDRANSPGINFGLPGTPHALDVYLSMMEGCGLPWVASLFGDPILESPLARHALERGGHIRVGIEDAAIDTGMGNIEMVEAAVALANEVGRPVVTGRDALGVLRNTAAA